MDNKVKMLNSDGSPVYVAPECVRVFERSGYKFAEKSKPAVAEVPKAPESQTAQEKPKKKRAKKQV